MMDLNPYYAALRNADAAGDTAAATKLTQFIKTQQTAPPMAAPEPPAPLEGREAQRAGIQGQYERGEVGPIGRGVLLAGSAAGSIGDKIGEGIAAITPPPVKRAVGGAVQAVEQTAPVQYTEQQYAALKKDHPQIAQYLEAIGNIATMLPVGKLAEVGAIKGGKNAAAGAELMGKGVAEKYAGALDTHEQHLHDVATEGFKKADAAGVKLEPQKVQQLVSDLKGMVKEPESAASKALYNDYMKRVGDLEADAAAGRTSLFNLHQHRQALGNIAKNITNPNVAQEADRAGKAIEHFDDFMLDQAKAGTGPREGINALYQGIKGWARLRNFEKIGDVVRRADGDQGKITRGLKAILDSDKKSLGLMPEEKALLQKAVKGGGLTEKALNVLGKFGLDEKSLLSKSVGYGLLGTVAGAPAAGGMAAIGTAAKLAGRTAQRGRIEDLLGAIYNRELPQVARSRYLDRPPQGPVPLLPSPERMSRLPMTDRQINIAQAQNRMMGGRPMPREMPLQDSPMVGGSPMPKPYQASDLRPYLDRAKEIKKELRTAPQFDINKPKTLWVHLGRVPQTLSEFIRTQGGVTDVGGDLKSMGVSGKNIAEAPSKLKQEEIAGIGGKKGSKHERGLDAMKEKAHDAGYFPEYEDWRDIPNDKFKAAIAEDAQKGGKRHYTADDMEEISKLSDALSKYDSEGISPKMSAEDIATILLRGRSH